MYAHVFVEGKTDIPVVDAVLRAAGWHEGEYSIVSTGGVGKLDEKIRTLANQPLHTLFLVFRDSDGKCPVNLLRTLGCTALPDDAKFCLRLVHVSIESWLMADKEGFSSHFGVSVAKIPDADSIDSQAKVVMLSCLASSRKSSISRRAVHKNKNGSLAFGPDWMIHLDEYTNKHWNVEAASMNSESLRRAVTKLSALHGIHVQQDR